MLKYRNVKTKADGYTFDSKAEAARYGELKLRVAAKEIEQLQVHPRYDIYVKHFNQMPAERVCTYVGDFEYYEVGPPGRRVVEDVKGVKTALYQLKKKLFRLMYPYIDFREIGK